MVIKICIALALLAALSCSFLPSPIVAEMSNSSKTTLTWTTLDLEQSGAREKVTIPPVQNRTDDNGDIVLAAKEWKQMGQAVHGEHHAVCQSPRC